MPHKINFVHEISFKVRLVSDYYRRTALDSLNRDQAETFSRGKFARN